MHLRSVLFIGALALPFTACLNDPAAEPKTVHLEQTGLSITATEGETSMAVEVDTIPRTFEDVSVLFSVAFPKSAPVVSAISHDTTRAIISGKSITFLENDGSVFVTGLDASGNTFVIELVLINLSGYLHSGVAKRKDA